jgi:hypothetical protein
LELTWSPKVKYLIRSEKELERNIAPFTRWSQSSEGKTAILYTYNKYNNSIA